MYLCGSKTNWQGPCHDTKCKTVWLGSAKRPAKLVLLSFKSVHQIKQYQMCASVPLVMFQTPVRTSTTPHAVLILLHHQQAAARTRQIKNIPHKIFMRAYCSAAFWEHYLVYMLRDRCKWMPHIYINIFVHEHCWSTIKHLDHIQHTLQYHAVKPNKL